MTQESVLRRLGNFFFKRQTMALADQAVVSGTNFLATVLVGRACSDAELGVYSLGFTFLVVMASLQEAIVNVPYTVFGARLQEQPRRELAGVGLIHHWMLVSLVLVGFLTVGIALHFFHEGELDSLFWILSATIPFFLLRDFFRRILFANGKMTLAWITSSLISIVQLGLLTALSLIDRLNPYTAHLALGGACLLIGLPALWMSRRHFLPRRGQTWSALARHWRFARWLLASQLVGVVHGFVCYWLLATLDSTGSTGAFAACMTVVMLSNPLILGMANYLGPQAGLAFAEGGAAAVGKTVRAATFLLGSAVGLFALILVFFGREVLFLIYGAKYASYGSTITVLAFAVLAGSLGIATEHGLRALERTDISLRAGSSGFAVTVLTSLWAIPLWGVFGGAVAYLMGSTTSTCVRGISFLLELKRQESTTSNLQMSLSSEALAPTNQGAPQ